MGGPFPARLQALGQRRNTTIIFGFAKRCLQGGAPRPVGRQTVRVVYNAKGITDQKRSDFNANGVPDGGPGG